MAAFCLLAYFNRLETLEWLKDERVTYSGNPQLISNYGLIFTWAPWVTIFFVLIARIKKGPQVKIGFYCLGLALPTVLLLGHLFLSPSFENYMNQEEFNETLWRKSDETSEDLNWPHKLKMVDSLIESKILDDLSREEVVKLLGTPTSDFSPEYRKERGNEIYYNLGPERGFVRIDSEWLSISFDENEKVKKYWLWTD